MNNDNDIKIIGKSSGNDYLLVKAEEKYYIFVNDSQSPDFVRTPGGTPLSTMYREVADKMLKDAQDYGEQCMSAVSILPWVYTIKDNFIKMKRKEIVEMLDDCFLKQEDWTYNCSQEEKWVAVFGNQKERTEEIKKWLEKCTEMQLTAACCVGNAYHSLNIAYVLAMIMENYSDNKRKKQFKALSNIINEKYPLDFPSELLLVFKNFDLYYGIHLKEDGSKINKTFEAIEESEPGDFDVSEALLVGRNYYHYFDFNKKNQPLTIDHDLISLLDDDVDDEDDECDDELEGFIPADCWLKKICHVDEESNVTNYLVAIEVKDGKAVSISVLRDDIDQMGGMYSMPFNHIYEDCEIEDCDDVAKEIENLKKGRYISNDLTFIGKKLPQEIIDNDKYNGSDVNYLVCLQSAHRSAYVDLFINTDEDCVIEEFEYSTYQSTGSGYWDMFSRPHNISDTNEEALDMLLYILDNYTDEEYEKLF